MGNIIKAIIITLTLLIPSVTFSQAIVADHNSVQEFDQIPENYLTAAKNLVKMYYGHTSHGSQISSGIAELERLDSFYAYTNGWVPAQDELSYVETSPDAGYYPAWFDNTVNQLNNNSGHRNTVMWSWCGQVSGITEATMNSNYLTPMADLASDYPDVDFIYMTGHLDTTGSTGNLHQRNEQIRNAANQRGGILFDFADIERFDPDGNDYLDLGAGAIEGDGCRYDGGGNWCTEWCDANSTSDLCSDIEEGCGHSFDLNCNMKARAFWWMLARMAGWDGTGGTDSTPPIISNGQPSGDIAPSIQTTLSVSTNENATCKYSTTAGVDFNAVLNEFSTTGTRAHSQLLGNLQDNTSYSYYVRCQDAAGNANDSDYPVSFTVLEADGTPPSQITDLSIISCDENSCDLSWSAPGDDENTGTASDYEIRYSASSITSQNFSQATLFNNSPNPAAPGSAQSVSIGSLASSTTYYFAMRTADEIPNWSIISNVVFDTTDDSVIPDTDAPVLSNGQPSNELPPGTTQVTISVNTNEPANCRYSEIEGLGYYSMDSIQNSGQTYHSFEALGLEDGQSYVYYLKCMDSNQNINLSDYEISFSVTELGDPNIDPQVSDDEAIYTVLGGCGVMADANSNMAEGLIMGIFLLIGLIAIIKKS